MQVYFLQEGKVHIEMQRIKSLMRQDISIKILSKGKWEDACEPNFHIFSFIVSFFLYLVIANLLLS